MHWFAGHFVCVYQCCLARVAAWCSCTSVVGLSLRPNCQPFATLPNGGCYKQKRRRADQRCTSCSQRCVEPLKAKRSFLFLYLLRFLPATPFTIHYNCYYLLHFWRGGSAQSEEAKQPVAWFERKQSGFCSFASQSKGSRQTEG